MSDQNRDTSRPYQTNKNPLLSASVTGLTFDDFTNKAIILPAAALPPKVPEPKDIKETALSNMSLKTIVIMACIIGTVYMEKTPVPKKEQTALNSKFILAKKGAESINIINGPLIIIGQGPWSRILHIIQEIISLFSGNTANTALKAFDLSELCPPLSVLTGKASILAKVPAIFPPVRATLVNLEAVTEGMVNSKDPTEEQIVQFQTYKTCLTDAITAYTPLTEVV